MCRLLAEGHEMGYIGKDLQDYVWEERREERDRLEREAERLECKDEAQHLERKEEADRMFQLEQLKI